MVGSANVDLVVEVPRRPAPGETLLGGDLQRFAGGKGANQAAGAARCGAVVEFVARVGDDADGAFVRQQLAAAGVGLSGVTDGPRATGSAIIMLTPDGENSIVVSPGANAELHVDRIEQQRGTWHTARVLVLSLEIPLETVAHVAREAAATGARIVVNAAPAAPLDGETLRLCDPLIVNEHEARVLSGGDDSAPQLAQALLALGARSVVVTLGARGALVAEASTLTHIPAFAVPVVDTTGAGDVFVGAVACELARGASLIAATEFASAAAALAVQRIGAQASYADRAEIEAFMSGAGTVEPRSCGPDTIGPDPTKARTAAGTDEETPHEFDDR